MNVQLFYFDGCPSYLPALDNLNEALRLEGLSETVEMILVTTDADAHAKRLIGSPTVRVDGVDLEGREAEARGFALGCLAISCTDPRPHALSGVSPCVKRCLQSIPLRPEASNPLPIGA